MHVVELLIVQRHQLGFVKKYGPLRRNGTLALHVFVLVIACGRAMAQLPQTQTSENRTSSRIGQLASTSQQTDTGQSGNVQLNLQGQVKLDTLLNYISQRLGTRFEYSQKIGDRSIVLRAPQTVPVASLPILLSSVLRTEGLALIDSDIAGWKRVVDVAQMVEYAPAGDANVVLRNSGPAAPVTQVFVLEHIANDNLSTILTPFLTKQASNVLSPPNSNILIVTDYAPKVQRVADLLEILDQPGGTSIYILYEAKHQEAATLAEQVNGILTQQTSEGSQASLFAQPSSNQIVIAGNRNLVQQARALLQQLDISLGMITEVYRIKHTTAERIDKLTRGFLRPQAADRVYQSTVDEEGNLLVVRATDEVHRQLAKLVAEIDVPVDSSDSPIRFYKLRNASAIDVLYTLLALQEAYGTGNVIGGIVPAGFYSPFGGGVSAFPAAGFGGAPFGANSFNNMNNATGAGALQSTRLPLTPQTNGFNGNDNFMPDTSNPLARPTMADGSSFDGNQPLGSGTFNSSSSGLMGNNLLGQGGVATLPGGARVSADVSTNSLIVVAPANVQEMYAELIRSLDQRRPQVLIEAKIIAVDTSDDFSLGVEVSIGDREGSKRLFQFTSFGLSEVDAQTGALTIIPGLGFNGTLVDPDVADVVVRALTSHSRARVLAAPKILVNDNSTGKLESVNSVPFASVNASQTVSTTSLGGDQQAGTIITATPHINEDDHLQLDFDVEFSTFSGTSTDGLPPPRQIDRVGSTVTIPDGKTVVVGGLKRVSDSETFTGLPWAEKIPIIRTLTSRTDRANRTTSFFLFIRPVILRDSRFADLRFLSEKETGRAQISGDFPVSRPELIP